MGIVLFKMWAPFRETLITEHRFYVEQARKRLLSQFGNIESEADSAAAAHLERMAERFDPDRHDLSDFHEAAHEKGMEFYRLLSEMCETTRLSVAAGMFHQWDKQLRDWIVREMDRWHDGEHTAKAIRKADFSKIIEFLAGIGFDAGALPRYVYLKAMHLVVNVFKHGDGDSFDRLKTAHPEYFSDTLASLGASIDLPVRFLDHTHLKVSDVHLAQFSEAILDFWRAVPEQIPNGEALNVPKWFEDAIGKDRAHPVGRRKPDA